MRTIRFNITLPQDIGNKLKPIKNKSSVIAESLRDRFQKEEKERTLALLAEAYAASAREEKSLRGEWEATLGDGL